MYTSFDPRTARIEIHQIFKGYPLAIKSVAWHEFCHAEKWFKDGKTDGHGSAWRDRMWRKPFLCLLNYTYTSLLYWKLKLERKNEKI